MKIANPIRPSWRKKYRRELPVLASGVWILAGLMLMHDWPLIQRAKPHRPAEIDDSSAMVASARESVLPSRIEFPPPISIQQQSIEIPQLMDMNPSGEVKLPVNLAHVTGWPFQGPLHFDFMKNNQPLAAKDAVVYIPYLFW